MTTLIWFQRDLRLQDNSALRHAMLENGDLIAVYIHSPQEDAPWSEGAASRWWLHQSLRKLHDDLRQINIELQFFQGKSRELIPELVDFYNATTVTWTGRHEPQRRVLEQTISNHLQQDGIHVNIFRDELLSQPDQFFTKTAQSPYRVFTPFYKRLRAELSLEAQEPSASPLTTRSVTTIERHVRSLTLDQLQLLNDNTWHEKLHRYWIPGERTAIEKLERFIDNSMASYPTDRDYPALNGTSGLSPHLHFGEISPTQLLDALVPLIEFGDAELSLAAEVFLRQLIWREFARYILLHFPETATEPMNKRFTPGFWKNDPQGLRAWQEGKTGIAIIDAGMHQLWQTGCMHNRVRMLVASLLTKNMGIRWQDGAKWFWETLVDADLANNTMGWQWVAGCGVDAAPYFRIFNPDTQARRFDAEQHYVKRWIRPGWTQRAEAAAINLPSTRQHALDRYNDMIRNQK